MERALASEWEENSALERQSKAEGNRRQMETWYKSWAAKKSKGTSPDICRAQKRRLQLGNGGKRGGSETDEAQITKPNLHKLWA